MIFGFEHNERYPDAPPVPETVLINPTITPVSLDMEEGWEGCLSVPGLRGAVSRFSMIKYHGFDQYGKPIDRVAEGFHARNGSQLRRKQHFPGSRRALNKCGR